MSYLVLARKWRPQTFGEVVGQGHVTRTLQNAIKQERLAHAIIFSGARGVGKTSIARIVAKAINCENGPAEEPCNQCAICQGITKGHCVDVIEIDGASNRGIDEIRHLRENIVFHPVQCRFKVYIIDEVHMLTREAFNALLKTLEEPPRHVYFIFATTEASKIPETIRSRCQHYEFRLLRPTEIYNHLSMICERDHLGLEPQAIELISRAAQGSIRDSLSLLDQVVAFGARSKEDVHEALGLIPSETISMLVTAILKGRVKEAMLAIDHVNRHGGDLKRLAQGILYLLRDLLLLDEIGDEARDLFSNPIHELEPFKKEPLDGDVLKEAIGLLARSMDHIARSSTPRLLLETTVIRMCQLKDIVNIDHIIEKLAGVDLAQVASKGTVETRASMARTSEAADASGVCCPAHSYSKASSSEAGHDGGKTSVKQENTDGPHRVDPGEGPKNVQGFISYLKQCLNGGNDPLFHYVQGLESVDLAEDGTLRFICGNTFLEERLKAPGLKEKLKSSAKAYFDRDLKVIITCANGRSAENSGNNALKAKEPDHPAQQKELREHPLVQEVIRVFGARVESVELFRP